MNKYFLLVSLLIGLSLSACGVNPSSELDTISSPPTESSQIVTSEDDPLLTYYQGYESSWPTTRIANYLSEYDVTTTVPSLSGVNKIYYVETSDENGDYLELFIQGDITPLERYRTLLTGNSNFMGEAFDENYHVFVDIAESMAIEVVYLAESEYGPEGVFFFIYAILTNPGALLPGLSPIDPSDPVYGNFNGIAPSFPLDKINALLASIGLTDLVPDYPGVSDVYYSEFEDEYGPYAGVFIKGAIAVMENYLTVLENDGWTIEVDTEYDDSYYGLSNHEQVVCEIFYTDIFGVGHEGVIMYFYEY